MRQLFFRQKVVQFDEIPLKRFPSEQIMYYTAMTMHKKWAKSNQFLKHTFGRRNFIRAFAERKSLHFAQKNERYQKSDKIYIVVLTVRRSLTFLKVFSTKKWQNVHRSVKVSVLLN
jgi:hypothetical protein